MSLQALKYSRRADLRRILLRMLGRTVDYPLTRLLVLANRPRPYRDTSHRIHARRRASRPLLWGGSSVSLAVLRQSFRSLFSPLRLFALLSSSRRTRSRCAGALG